MKRIFIALVFLVLLCPFQLSAEEVPKLIVPPDTLKFSCQPVCGVHQDFSFPLYAEGGEVTNLQILKKEIKNPDGMSLSTTALDVKKEKDTVSNEGITITLIIKNDDFLRPGDYTIVLLFKGKATPVKPAEGKAAPDKPADANAAPAKPVELPPITITINRPAAEINLEELKDRTIIMKRPFFWWSCASGESTFDIYEKDDKAAISNLRFSSQNVFQGDTKIQVPGKVKLAIAKADEGLTQCLPVQKQLPVTLTFSGLEQTGDFSTGLRVQSPSLKTPCSIPIKLQVTDWWYWALLVIALGVAGGYGTRYLAKQYRPRQENLLQITRLRGTLAHWEVTAHKLEKKKKLAELDRQLQAAEEKNNQGDAPGAQAILTSLEASFTTYRQEEDNDFIRITTDYGKLKTQINRLNEHVLDTGKKTKLQDILDEMKNLEPQLLEGEIDQADDLLAKGQKKFKDFLTNELDVMESEINQDPANLGEFKTHVQEIRDLLPSNLEDAVTKFMALTIDLKNKSTRPSLAMYKAPVAPAPVFQVKHSPDPCVSGGKITFSLENQPAGSRVEWVLGDGTTKTQEVGMSYVEHTYKTSGKYLVEAALVITNQPAQSYSQWVTVAPGWRERYQTTAQSLKRTNLLISLVALLLATFSGLLYLYFTGKPFGSVQDYLKAILWGFGVENGVYGFAQVLKKINE